jgi:BASS family bile acid:Na+ symporter
VDLDSVRLNFNPHNVWTVDIIIAVIMFGVALDLKAEDFQRVVKMPKAAFLGLFAQFLLFPAATYLLTRILNPHPSIALGMVIVAACPSGNMSNFITYMAKGNTALSVSITAVATCVAVVMTPINIWMWGHLNPITAPLLHRVSLNSGDMLMTVFIILGIPLILGISFARFYPHWADKLHKPFKAFSVSALLLIIAIAFAGNFGLFTTYFLVIISAVLPQNALAFAAGYGLSRAARLNDADTRAVTIELGIHNSALGLTLIFGYFSEHGGAALIAGFWGVWHIVAGLILASLWARVPILQPAEEAA